MRKDLLGKTLVLGVILLFIGVGVHPVFASEDKTSTESFTIDNENEAPIIDDEFYENTNCIIMGKTTETERWPEKGRIYFGYFWEDFGTWEPSIGYIITISNTTKWIYKGKFYGRAGPSHKRWDPAGYSYIHYCGVEGFEGFGLGGKVSRFGFLIGNCFFIGFAERVRISPNHPESPWS